MLVLGTSCSDRTVDAPPWQEPQPLEPCPRLDYVGDGFIDTSEELADLATITHAEIDIVIENHLSAGVADLDCLEVAVGGVSVQDMPNLEDLSLARLRVADDIEAVRSPSLRSIHAPRVQELRVLWLVGNEQLEVLEVYAPATLEVLAVGNVPKLESLGPLHRVEHADSFSIVATSLKDLHELRSLQTTVLNFSVRDNPELASFHGLENLRIVGEDTTFFSCGACPDQHDPNWFPCKDGPTFTIRDNPKLEGVQALLPQNGGSIEHIYGRVEWSAEVPDFWCSLRQLPLNCGTGRDGGPMSCTCGENGYCE
jgi:hypothetical protein